MLPFPQCGSASTINLYKVLFKLFALHDLPSPLPLPGVVADKVLQKHIVSLDQGGKALGVRFPLLTARDVPPGHGVLPVVQQLTPWVWIVLV